MAVYYIQKRPYSSEMYHHGIKGQKWGKRNGPPYPLSDSDHSASEKKAGWKKSLNGDKEQSPKNRRGLTDKQKKWIKIGAAAAVTALAVGGAVYMAKTGQFKNLSSIGEEAAKNIMANPYLAAGEQKVTAKVGKVIGDIDRDMVRSINSQYRGTAEGSANCTHCVLSYILNSVYGRSTSALPSVNGQIIDEISGAVANGRDPIIFKAIFDNIVEHDFRINGLQKGGVPIKDAFKDVRPGSTGIVSIPGHVLNYEKDSAGLVTIIDPQRSDILPLTYIMDHISVLRIFDLSDSQIRDGAEAIIDKMVTT